MAGYLPASQLLLLLVLLPVVCWANFCYQAVSGTADMPSGSQMVSCANAAGCIRGKVSPLLGGASTYFWDCMGFADFGSYSPSWSWWLSGSQIESWSAAVSATPAPAPVVAQSTVLTSWNINWVTSWQSAWTRTWSDQVWSYWGGTAWSASSIDTSAFTWTAQWNLWTSWLGANNLTNSTSSTNTTSWGRWNLGSSSSWLTWNSWGYLGTARYTCTDGGFEGYWNSAGKVIHGVYIEYCVCCADGCNQLATCGVFSAAVSPHSAGWPATINFLMLTAYRTFFDR